MLHRIFVFLCCVQLCSCVVQSRTHEQGNSVTKLNFNRIDAAKARLDLALSYLNQNNYQQAKVNLDKALQYAPELPEVHYSRAYFFQKIKDEENAEKHYQIAFELAPNDPDVQHNYGSYLCTRGQFQKAKDLLIAAIKSPHYAKANRSYLNLAYCSIELDRFLSALEYLELAHKHQPEQGETALMLAGLNFGLKNDSNALVWYKSYLSIATPSARGMLLGVLIYQKLGLNAELEQAKNVLLTRFSTSLEAELMSNSLLFKSEFYKLRRRVEQFQ